MSNATENLADPNFLAFLAHGLDEAQDRTQRRDAQSFLDDRLLKRQAAILDSLAYISVSREQSQVVAVGAVLLDDGNGIQILVAENQPLQRALLDYIRDVFHRLSRISAERPVAQGEGSPPVSRFIPAVKATSGFERGLVDLEIVIILHCWKKLRQRATKNLKQNNFMLTADDICGDPAQERTDLDETERDLLVRLQTYAGIDHANLKRLADNIQLLVALLSQVPDETRAKGVRACLEDLLTARRPLQQQNDFFVLWNSYTRCRLVNKGAVVRKEPNAFHWLSKVLSIREHFLRIANIVNSPTLSKVLLHGVLVDEVKNTVPRPNKFSVDHNGMQRVLAAAGCTPEDSQEESMDDLFTRIRNKQPSKAKLTMSKLDVTSSAPVHCECQMLAHIHAHAKIHYIGVSKLSCGFCDAYFSSYRSITGSKMCTRGTHGQTANWTCPTITDTIVDSDIRKDLCLTLLKKIRKGWKDFRRGSLSSQSTTTSGEERSWESALAEQVGWDKQAFATGLDLPPRSNNLPRS
ncbi:hypothetical protein FB451DRAFT_1386902 [Mycena latifolia]|nr:hypothetical protein FB451DRAFT_1386902 [Mycena latifolia]